MNAYDIVTCIAILVCLPLAVVFQIRGWKEFDPNTNIAIGILWIHISLTTVAYIFLKQS